MALDMTERWNRHADDPEGVFAELRGLVDAAEDGRDLFGIGALGSHVAGSHLGAWSDGIALLDRLVASPHHDAAQAEGRGLHRLLAQLALCAGDGERAEAELARARGPEAPEGQTRLRMVAAAAEALADQGRIEQSAAAFDEALALASYGPDRDDPAARSLAIAGNNIACALEVRDGRSEAATALMKRAAHAGRTWWAVAGDWTHVKIAEVRLAMSHLAAGEPGAALGHAQAALALCDAHDGGDPDRFYPWLTVARCQAAVGDRKAAAVALAEAESRVQPWGRAELDEVRGLVQ